tara:strand:+ start:1260 stop:2375 length:1116 start_codon:yes stop_codon:yes gene_type:complete
MAVVPTEPVSEIFLRSPYWLFIEEANLDYVICELRIWTGEITEEPVTASAKLRSTALNGKTSIDIAEFGRDFVEVTFSGEADSNAIFMSYELTIYEEGASSNPAPETRVYLTGLDGYSTFQDGVNYQWWKQTMVSDSNITSYSGQSMRIPVLQRLLTGYKLQRLQGGLYHTFREVTGLVPATNTADLILNISNSYQNQNADRLYLSFSEGGDEYVDFKYNPCTKYGITRVYFVNRLGCVQEMHFGGKFSVEVNVEFDKYKRNILVDGNYDSNRHQSAIFHKNGTIKMTLNTDWRREEENDSIIEMMMSEQVWVRVDADKLGRGWAPQTGSSWTVPVNVVTSSSKIKSLINDKLINYTFDFEAAHDWINTVR